MNLKNGSKLLLGKLESSIHFDLVHLDSCESTQDCALEYSRDNQKNTLLISDSQTKGRGRRGREWSGNPQSSLLMTLSFHKKDLPVEATLLSLYAGALLYALLNQHSEKFSMLTLKWPNDIGLYDRNTFKKAAGILVELKKDWYLVGVGLNLKGPAPWTGALSLNELDKKHIEKKTFARSFAENFLNPPEDSAQLADSLLEYLSNRAMQKLWGKELSQNWNNHKAVGLAGDGALITQAPDGKTHCVYSGII